MSATPNPMTDTLRAHTSVRAFTDEPVSQEDLEAIYESARAASSTCFLQVTTAIRITDKELKAKLAELAGNQKHIIAAPEFWVFCADYHRDQVLVPKADLGWTEQLIVGCVDAAIQAQNAFAALEALGLGGVYAGGIRNHIEEVDRLLKLPQNAFPVVGLAFGHPAHKNELKPRLPASITLCENAYQEPDPAELKAYDEEMRNYYQHRSSNAKDTAWSDELERILLRERRPFVLGFLQKSPPNGLQSAESRNDRSAGSSIAGASASSSPFSFAISRSRRLIVSRWTSSSLRT